jgi:ribonuclease P protein component
MSVCSAFEEAMREAHVPTQQPEAQEEARLPWPDAQSWRAGGAAIAPRARPQAPQRLIWRIRDRATFEALARARRHRRGPISLRHVPGDAAEPPRVAFALGRNVGGAVDRNRARRRLRAAIGGQAERLGPGAYLFGGGPDVVTVPFPTLEAAVADLLDAAGDGSR